MQLGTVGKVSRLESRRLLAWPPVRRTTVSSGSSSDAPGQIYREREKVVASVVNVFAHKYELTTGLTNFLL